MSNQLSGIKDTAKCRPRTNVLRSTQNDAKPQETNVFISREKCRGYKDSKVHKYPTNTKESSIKINSRNKTIGFR